MTDFAETWAKAQDKPDRDDAPPPDGLYEVALKDAKAFVSSAGNDVVVFEFKAFSPSAYEGHEWSTIYVVGKTPTWLVRKEFDALGADTSSVERFEDLDAALKPCVGRYFEVQVEHKGKYCDTYVQRAITQELPPVSAAAESDVPADVEGLAQAGQAASDDVPW